MSYLAAIAVVVFVAVAFIIFARAVKFFLRLAIVGIFLFILLAGLLAWWYGSGDSVPARNQNRPAANAPQRRSNTNR